MCPKHPPRGIPGVAGSAQIQCHAQHVALSTPRLRTSLRPTHPRQPQVKWRYQELLPPDLAIWTERRCGLIPSPGRQEEDTGGDKKEDPPCPADDLEHRYRQSHDPVERTHWHMLWLVAQGNSCPTVATMVGSTRIGARSGTSPSAGGGRPRRPRRPRANYPDLVLLLHTQSSASSRFYRLRRPH